MSCVVGIERGLCIWLFIDIFIVFIEKKICRHALTIYGFLKIKNTNKKIVTII